MAKRSFKPGTLLAPLPAVMISCGRLEDGTENIITVAWTGIINSDPPRTYVSVTPRRASYEIIRKYGEFVINLVPEHLAAAMDWCGCVSKNKEQKFSEKSGLTAEPSEKVGCPSIKESPVQLECRVFETKDLGSHTMFMADIVNIRVDESVLTGEGRIAMERLNLVSVIHGSYYAAPSQRIGRMGFSVMKESTKKKISAQQRAKFRARQQGKEKFDRG